MTRRLCATPACGRWACVSYAHAVRFCLPCWRAYWLRRKGIPTAAEARP